MATHSQNLELLQTALSQVQGVREGALQLLDNFSEISSLNPQQAKSVLDLLASVQQQCDSLQASWPKVEPLLQQARCRGGAKPGSDTSELPSHEAELEAVAALQRQQAARWAHLSVSWSAAALPPLDQGFQRGFATQPSDCARGRGKRKRAGSHEPEPSHKENVERLQAIVEGVRKLLPDLKITLTRGATGEEAPGVSAALCDQVVMLIPNRLCACVVLAGPGDPSPVRVTVGAVPERQRLGTVDGWSRSPYQVFQQLSSLACRALSFFQQRAASEALVASEQGGSGSPGGQQGSALSQGGLAGVTGGCSGAASPVNTAAPPVGTALEDVLLWLAQYEDLFRAPCCVTGKLLAWDPCSRVPLPPLLRPFMLSRDQLMAAATNPSVRQAYHMHVAPEELLGWSPMALNDEDMQPLQPMTAG